MVSVRTGALVLGIGQIHSVRVPTKCTLAATVFAGCVVDRTTVAVQPVQNIPAKPNYNLNIVSGSAGHFKVALHGRGTGNLERKVQVAPRAYRIGSVADRLRRGGKRQSWIQDGMKRTVQVNVK